MSDETQSGESISPESCLREVCVHELFEQQLKLTPHAIAVRFAEQRLTYRQLDRRSNQLAHLLIQQGARADAPIGICLQRSPELIISVLAVLKAGAACLPLDPAYPIDRLHYMLKNAGAELVISQSGFIDRIPPDDGQVLVFEQIAPRLELQAATQPNRTSDTGHLCYLIYTSGSTGKPKGVAMEHRPLVNLLQWQSRQFRQKSGIKTLQFTPLSFDVSFQEIFSTLTTGGELVLINDELRLDATKFAAFLRQESIQRLFLPYLALQQLTEAVVKTDKFPESLQEVFTAGEQLQITPSIKTFFSALANCTLSNQYGPTETHVVSAWTLSGNPQHWPSLPPIGTAIDNTRLYILDENLKVLESGYVGELYVGGRALARGYINRDDLTRERFIADPFRKDGSRIYATGDLVKRDDQGCLEYLGRKDGQVKIRGYRVEVGEIEVALSQYPGISHAVVHALGNTATEKRLVAYFTAEQDSDTSISALRQFLQARLPDYMMPSAFVPMNDFPKTPSGKIDRKSLPEPGRSRPQLQENFVAPADELERRLHKIWCHALQIDDAGTNDVFFDLGGNSLLSLNVISEINEEENIDISIVDLFNHPTISGLARFIREKDYSKPQGSDDKSAFKSDGNNFDGVAVIGMAVRVPGADTVSQFWQNLCEGKESIQFFTDQQISPSIPESLRKDPAYVKARGLIADADKFDAEFFNINPREAEVTDPQQRVFLEECWHALEDAGVRINRGHNRFGVYAGIGNNSYYRHNVQTRPDVIEMLGEFQAMVANEKDYIATRVAHKLDLHGPALSIHTACSTSLVAISEAYFALKSGRCDMALAGGASVCSPQESGHRHEEGGIMSHDGHCRPFDINAGGTLFSDGVGVVVLKRLQDALNDKDSIYAVIRGAAVNNDGGNKMSFTAPNADGQAKVIAMAQREAGVEADSITYIEAHGTATPIGDPIEISALDRAFSLSTGKKQFCALGSVKSNFGHLTAAAGIAGFIKTCLAIKHGQIPPTINFSEANPDIKFSNTPFYIADKLQVWDNQSGPRTAGVSSFGVGGTNAHVILQEAPENSPASQSRSRQLMLFSAKTADSLRQYRRHFSDAVSRQPTDLANAAYTLQTCRTHFEHRSYCILDPEQDIAKQLKNPAPALSGERKKISDARPPIGFMFPGQGSQYVNMGLNLYESEPVFRIAMDQCFGILDGFCDLQLKPVLYPTEENNQLARTRLSETLYTQPALFSVGYALARLWASWGIRPSAMIGHSVGEFTAACLAGVFTLEDALRLVADRGRMMQELPTGSMISVRLPAEELQAVLPDSCSIAAINGPSLCVASGPDEDIQQIRAELESTDTICHLLHTSHAFHSPMMEPIMDDFAERVAATQRQAPKIPFVSTAENRWISDEDAVSPEYWAKHLRKPVRFAEGVRTLWERDDFLLLELGPRATASTLARQQAKKPDVQLAIQCLADTADNQREWESLLAAIGQLWLSKVEIDWAAFYAGEERRKMSLPGYAFEKKRYWLEPAIGPCNSATQHTQTDNTKIQEDLSMPGQNESPTMSRKEKLVGELRALLEETSGTDLSTAGAQTTFFEMGLDSLFLTQAGMSIKKKFSVPVSFRQLQEDMPTLGLLAEYLNDNLPAGTYTAPTPASVREITASLTGAPNTVAAQTQTDRTALENLITQQMQLMSQQLRLLQSGQIADSGTAAISSASLPGGETCASDTKTDSETDENPETPLKAFGAQTKISLQSKSDLNKEQNQALQKFNDSYIKKHGKSRDYAQQHRRHLADPRTVSGFHPLFKELVFPIVVNQSKGARLWDIDGNEYIDLTNGFGSNMLGFSQESVTKALHEQLDRGVEIGPQTPLAGEVAALICEMTGLERAAFCNTGSEAVLGAMRLARTVTGKDLIVYFKDDYHGVLDEAIVRGTASLRSLPAAPGIPAESVQNVLLLDYGRDQSLEIIRQRAAEIGGVMVEPVQSRHPSLQPKAFLHKLRSLTREIDVPLIMDEVITGFRINPGGAQAHFGVQADIATYGKVIGGGMPIGVIAGSGKYLDALDGGQWQYGDESFPEVGVTYFAGTFVRHPLAMAAAKTVLLHLKEKGPQLQGELNQKTDNLVSDLNDIFTEAGIGFAVENFGSLFKIQYTDDEPLAELLFYWLRQKGLHIWDARPCFLTTAHTDLDIAYITRQFSDTVAEMCTAGLLGRDCGPVEQKPDPGGHDDIIQRADNPPVDGARLGITESGDPAWFVSNPEAPGEFTFLKRA